MIAFRYDDDDADLVLNTVGCIYGPHFPFSRARHAAVSDRLRLLSSKIDWMSMDQWHLPRCGQVIMKGNFSVKAVVELNTVGDVQGGSCCLNLICMRGAAVG